MSGPMRTEPMPGREAGGENRRPSRDFPLLGAAGIGTIFGESKRTYTVRKPVMSRPANVVPHRRPWLLTLVVLGVGLLGGCVDHTTRGATTIYHYSWWCGPLAFVGGLLFVPGGLMLRRVSERLGLAMLILSPVLLFGFLPGAYLNRVVVDDEHVEVRNGIWFIPQQLNVKFADADSIRFEERRTLRGKRKYELVCDLKSGKQVSIEAGELEKAAAAEITLKSLIKGVGVGAEGEE